MFKRNKLQRFNIYLGLFAILLISICPVISQTIALIESSVSQRSITQHLPSTNHFECAYEFLKANGLNPDDFADDSSQHHGVSKASHDTSHKYDEHSLAKCGYCDLLHTATIFVAFYVTALQNSYSETVVNSSDPYLLSLNYWSISSRGPPTLSLS